MVGDIFLLRAIRTLFSLHFIGIRMTKLLNLRQNLIRKPVRRNVVLSLGRVHALPKIALTILSQQGLLGLCRMCEDGRSRIEHTGVISIP